VALLDTLYNDVHSSFYDNFYHVLLATHEQSFSNYENNTRGINSKLVCKIGYIDGGHGEHGQCIVIHTLLNIRQLKVGFGYLFNFITNVSSNNCFLARTISVIIC